MKSIWTISKITPLLAQDAVNVEFEHLHGNLCFSGLTMRVHGFKPEIGGKFAFEYIPAETEFQKQSRMVNEAQQVWASQDGNVFNTANQNHVRQKWGDDPFIGGQKMYPAMPKAPLLPYTASTGIKAERNAASNLSALQFSDKLPEQGFCWLPYGAAANTETTAVVPEESESDRIARVTQSMCK